MNQNRLATILLSPHVTEKATMVGDSSNQFVFKVLKNANKLEIKASVEKMFSVKVASVKVLNVKGKTKRSGNAMGRRKDWKKAYVRLEQGHDIDFMGAD
jgi:large subunit ribosomal protein L23